MTEERNYKRDYHILTEKYNVSLQRAAVMDSMISIMKCCANCAHYTYFCTKKVERADAKDVCGDWQIREVKE